MLGHEVWIIRYKKIFKITTVILKKKTMSNDDIRKENKKKKKMSTPVKFFKLVIRVIRLKVLYMKKS
jgi:hypothetical protein